MDFYQGLAGFVLVSGYVILFIFGQLKTLTQHWKDCYRAAEAFHTGRQREKLALRTGPGLCTTTGPPINTFHESLESLCSRSVGELTFASTKALCYSLLAKDV